MPGQVDLRHMLSSLAQLDTYVRKPVHTATWKVEKNIGLQLKKTLKSPCTFDIFEHTS